MSGQINKRDKNEAASVHKRIEKINNTVDNESEKILADIDLNASNLDTIIDILQDRVVQSTDPSFVIALARLSEMRLDTIKKKIDLLKALIVDKGNDITLKKKQSTSELDDILSGVIAGAQIANNVNNIKNIKVDTYETIDVENAEIEIESENVNSNNDLLDSDIDNIIGDNK